MVNQYQSLIFPKSQFIYIYKKVINFIDGYFFFLLTQHQKLNTAAMLGIETSVQTFF